MKTSNWPFRSLKLDAYAILQQVYLVEDGGQSPMGNDRDMNVLRDKVGVAVTIEDFIIQRRLRWYGHVICRDISSQIREVMEHEIPGKRKKGRPRKSWEECIKKDLEQYGLRREDAYDQVKWREHIKAKIANPGQPR